MTDWRYWITYTGRVQTDSDDEDAGRLAASAAHAEMLQDESKVYLAEVEVEPSGGQRMTKWNVCLEAGGMATVTVDADTSDEAEAKALMTVPGFTVEGGGVIWETVSVWVAEDD